MPMKYQAMAEADPWGVIMLALNQSQKPVDEDLEDGVRMAAMMIAGAALVSGGVDIDAVERQFFERDWGVRITYDPVTEEVGLDIEWDDHPITSIRRVE